MTRKEIYEEIKAHGYADAIKEDLGDSYTRIKTNQLEDWINNHINETSIDVRENESVNYCCVLDGLQALVATLVSKHLLTPMEGEEIMDAIFK